MARRRETDQKALARRITRYNNKQLCSIQRSDGTVLEFLEPSREITFFGLLSKLQVWDPHLIELDILDYDDHRGIDLLTRKPIDPGDLLSRDQIAYVELKHTLEPRLNHAFGSLHAILCWESVVKNKDFVADVTGVRFAMTESVRDGVTYSQLTPEPDDKKHKHNITVFVVKRLLQQTRHLVMRTNPSPVNGRRKQ